MSRTEYQYSMQDPDAAELARYATGFVDRLKQLPELEDVASDLQNGGRQVALDFDRRTAMRLGLSAQTLDDTLYDSFGQRQVSTLFTQLNQYHLILEVQKDFRTSPANLGDIYMNSPAGPIPISAVTKAKDGTAPTLISHMGQFPATTVSFNLAPGTSLGAAVEAIQKVQQQMPEPPAMIGAFQGTVRGVRGLARQRGHPGALGAAHRLHRAGRALRELHSSHHHPLDAALRERRRTPRAPHLRQRAHGGGDHRHRVAHRHRAEECDHDDRLRARRRSARSTRTRSPPSARRACCAFARSS